MPKVSKETAPAQEQGPSRFWTGAMDGYKVDLVECNEDTDLTPLLQGLPNDQCPSPHWGYVLKGSMWWDLGNGREVYEAGDAYYVPPGHTSGASEGSEFIVFSPSDVMADVEAHMMRRAQELQGGS
jgi:mannose-6-phosphate isomerase-like protein (cupin superfamily)